MVSQTLAFAVILGSAALAPGQSPQGPATKSVTPSTTAESTPDTVDFSWVRGLFQGNDSGNGGPQFSASAEYLLWWLKADRPPQPLVTTGGAGGGALGASDTTVLFRLSDLDKDVPYSGGQFGFGLWLNKDERLGLDVSFFFLEQRSFTFTTGSNANGSPLLSVPFFDLNPAINGPSVSEISVPGVLAGHVEAQSTTRLWGDEVDFKTALYRSSDLSVNGILGYRQLDLRETFTFTQDVKGLVGYPLLSLAGSSVPAADSLEIADRFGTHNAFYGCDLGLKTTWSPFSKLDIDVSTKVAFGTVTETLNVSGSTTQLNPAGAVVQSVPGGLFALWSANTGYMREHAFGVLPEAALRVRYSVTDWMELSAGYEFLFLNSVVRPADQVSGTLNSSLAPSQVPFGNGGPIAPPPSFHRTDFSAQGLNVGVEFRF